ncbi:MAG: TetR/AcrR family transcriptional regulator [Armatimonadetes bacterium]|nr:TetR/AcrR family transcriptional regulator [Armatimonadota bacterium]
MSDENSSSSPRKLRADAQRNRDHILKVAREAFAERGDSVTFDDIVKLSGLGVGTLYRHFRTREALVEAMYFGEIERLAAAAGELAKSLPPVEALRQWMLLFVDLLVTKYSMPSSVNAIVGSATARYGTLSDMVEVAIGGLVDRGVASGEISLSFPPLDLLRALAGVANSGAGDQWVENARRMVDVLIAGIRT